MRRELSNVAYAYEKCLKEAGYVPSIQPPLMGAKEALAKPDPLLEVCKAILRSVSFGDMGPIQDSAYYLFEANAEPIKAMKAAVAKAEAEAKIYYT